MLIGVLALQGGFAAHLKMLDRLSVKHREVRLAENLAGLDGLILPGGESTTMLKLMAAYDLFEPIRLFGESGRPVLGTCAGAILMAARVNGNGQASFGWLPASTQRNAYGSQRESFEADLDLPAWHLARFHAYFIRAPKFLDVDGDAEILCRYNNDITAIGYRHFTATSFHPELGEDASFHQAWLKTF